ncbi:hypothetical protein [Mesobacillus subterraneus]|uniref:Uncharacterized protein n=1 Tax=Mesobacillus subterraneus TaxID=285983 RepID=A0A427TP14_9BACI|nr:hypothetical protein [Mesobacillus subterraneus]RSD26131.1 hypothetical protein EJA10_15000 [Mesobacillus subterraneus]
MVPASVFIMDISKSSSAASGDELSNYISGLEHWVRDWFQGNRSIQVKHRSGDELILIAEGYATAFTVAFYISRIWKYENHQPYFGLAFGSIEKNVDQIDIEKWIHPLVKQARIANDKLKKQKDRESFLFKVEHPEDELLILLNGMVSLQHELTIQQTEIQRLVCSLYLIYGKQNAVAELLGRSAPTIYSHFKKGHSEQILNSYRKIKLALNLIQSRSNNVTEPHDQEDDIRKYIRDRVEKIFSL